MTIKYSKRFFKNFKSRIASSKALNKKAQERITLFANNPHSPLLKDHSLKGNKTGLRSFSITGDIRIIYQLESETIYFLDIGTHNQVYK